MPEIIFTDTTSIWLFDNYNKDWFNDDPSHPLSVDKHSGKIHVWGSVSMLYGKISMTTFRVNLTADLLSTTLREDFLPEANYHYPEGWVLQMDNDPKNTSLFFLFFFSRFVKKLGSTSLYNLYIYAYIHITYKVTRKSLYTTFF